MFTTATPGRAGVEHGEERGEAAEARAVADAGGHRDHRRAHQPGDQRRQRAVHAGDRDHRLGAADGVELSEQPVHAGDADVVVALDLAPEPLGADRGLFGHGEVGGAGGEHGDR